MRVGTKGGDMGNGHGTWDMVIQHSTAQVLMSNGRIGLDIGQQRV